MNTANNRAVVTEEMVEKLKNLTLEMPNRIKLAMEEAGISVGDLAREMRVRDRTVQDWRSTGQVSKERLPLLAQLLDVSVDWLLTGLQAPELQQLDRGDVVAFERPNNSTNKAHKKDLTLIFSPVLEANEIFDSITEGEDQFDQKIQEFIDEPNTRPVIPLMVDMNNRERKNPLLGVPKFHIQLSHTLYMPYFRPGDFLGFTNSVFPWRGRMSLFAIQSETKKSLKWRLCGGFFCAIGYQQTSDTLNKTFEDMDKIMLKRHHDLSLENPDDVTIDLHNDTWMYLGQCTHLYRWEEQTLAEWHTNLTSRASISYEGAATGH